MRKKHQQRGETYQLLICIFNFFTIIFLLYTAQNKLFLYMSKYLNLFNANPELKDKINESDS